MSTPDRLPDDLPPATPLGLILQLLDRHNVRFTIEGDTPPYWLNITLKDVDGGREWELKKQLHDPRMIHKAAQDEAQFEDMLRELVAKL